MLGIEIRPGAQVGGGSFLGKTIFDDGRISRLGQNFDRIKSRKEIFEPQFLTRRGKMNNSHVLNFARENCGNTLALGETLGRMNVR
jgi:hypothetical protein